MKNRAGARRNTPFPVLVAALGCGALLSLTSCAPRITLVSDPVFAEVYRPADALGGEGVDDPEGGVSLRWFNPFIRDYRLDVIELETLDPSVSDVTSAVGRAETGTGVAVSPLLSRYASDVATEFPSRDVIALAATGSVPRPSEADGTAESGANTEKADQENVSRLEHDRRAAFRELGKRLAAELEKRSPEAKLVGYFRHDSPSRRAELEAFKTGIGDIDAQLELVTFDSFPTGSRLRDELFRVRRANTKLVAAFVGLHNDMILDEVAELGRIAATEDLGPRGAYGEVVPYSIERNYHGGIARFVEGERGTIVVDAQLVERDGTRGTD